MAVVEITPLDRSRHAISPGTTEIHSGMTTEIVRRCYDLHGFNLSVVGDSQQIDFLDPILGNLAAPDRTKCNWTVTLVQACEVVASQARSRKLWESALPEGPEATVFEVDRIRTLFVADHFEMSVDLKSRSSTVRFTSQGATYIRGTGAFWLLGEIMAATGRFLLHGACLIEIRSNQAIALFAPSGTGKTTTALALARRGMALAGDDALVLETSDDTTYLWGIPRGLKIHQQTAALMPWLSPVLGAWETDEQLVRLDALRDLVTIASTSRRRCGAVIILMAPNLTRHEIKPMSKTEAITHILSDNLRRAAGGVDANGQAAFAAIARLLAATQTISLSLGPDPCSLDSSLVTGALESNANFS